MRSSFPHAAPAPTHSSDPRAPLLSESEIGKVKKADSALTHKDAFKKAAGNWGKAKENPKNK